MHTTETNIVTFGRGGNAHEFQLFGWSIAEAGFTWTDGPAAGLTLPAADAPHGCVIELFGWPHRDGGRLPGQHIAIEANGTACGTGFVRDRARLAWFVPTLHETAQSLTLVFRFADAEKPTKNDDTRVLGIAIACIRIYRLSDPYPGLTGRISALPEQHPPASIRERFQRMTGVGPAELAMRLESLGRDCKIGFFQRLCDVEPLSLLRFSGTLQFSLLDGIEDGFAQLGDPEQIDPVADETTLADWVVYERRYWLRYHTWVNLKDASREDVKAREVKRLGFLKRKFVEDVCAGHKIFVYHDWRAVTAEEILPIHLTLRRQGNAPLLVLSLADADNPAGLVRESLPGLLTGYVTDLDADSPLDPSFDEWYRVVANAYLLMEPTFAAQAEASQAAAQ